VCTASDSCHLAGTCDPATGNCSNPNAPNGTACSDSNACTNPDTCNNGTCTPGTPTVCPSGTCDPTTGLCPGPTCATEKFDKTIPSPLTGGVNGIASDAAGGLYITGGFGSATDFTDLNLASLVFRGSADLYVVKIDPASGNTGTVAPLWAKSFGDA